MTLSRMWSAVDQHLSEGTPCDVECRLRTKDGEYRWFRTRGQAQRDANGEPTWMAGSLQDIHEQKTAEASCEWRFRRLNDSLNVCGRRTLTCKRNSSVHQGFDEIVGESEPLRSVLTQIEHVAATGPSVLLLGETGTGKELLAERSTSGVRVKIAPW